MPTWGSKEIIIILKDDGWYEVRERSKGRHKHFKHRKKAGKVTVPHPMKDIPAGTVGNISRQSGIKFKK